MYIEFTLPTGAGGLAAQHALSFIIKDLNAWSKKYDIRYARKIVKYTIRVFLPGSESYTLFGLTFDSVRSSTFASSRWRFVEPMDPPKSIDNTF